MRWTIAACAWMAFAGTSRAVEPVSPSPFVVGVCTHFSQGKGLLGANLDLMRQAGVTAIRDEVVWRGVESVKGRLEMPEEWDTFVRRTAAAGLKPMLILDYGNPFYDNGDKPVSEEAGEAFSRYAEFVVRHFKGVVHDYEIWNEYDISIGSKTPGSAENYAKLIKKVYPRIKAIDPSITVYGGAMTPSGVKNGWLEKMLVEGTLPFMDVVSIHTYNYGKPGREHTPEAWAEWMEQVQSLIRKYNRGKEAPLYITEMGWPTQIDKRGTPPAVSADYLARMYLLSRSMPFLKGIWWYDFQDDGWSATYNEANFGVVRPDLTPKPSYYALAAISEIARTSEFLGRLDTGDPEIYVLKFRDQSGQDTWALWSGHDDDDWQLGLKTSVGSPLPLMMNEVGRRAFQRPWGVRRWADERGAAATAGELDLTVRGTPWLITGDLSGVTVSRVNRRPYPEASRQPRPLAGTPQ